MTNKKVDVAAGIDVGASAVKVALIKGGKVLGWSVVETGLNRTASAQEALLLAIKEAGISHGEIKKILATGVGRKHVTDAEDSITEVVADARGVAFLYPSARTVIDIGAEEARGIRLNDTGQIQDFVKNNRCAAGVGAFLESMSRALGLEVEDMGPLSLKAKHDIAVNLTCAVFAESEVISLIHSQVAREDIARAIHEAIVSRTISMVNSIGIENDVVFIGGVANNVGVLDRFNSHLRTGVIVPENPQIVGAIGAAVYALKD